MDDQIREKSKYQLIRIGEELDEELDSYEEPKTVLEKIKAFFFVKLSPGISYLNLFAYFWAAFGTITNFVFVSAVAGFVLTTFLDIPQENQGTLAGDLGFYDEIVVVCTVSIMGLISDKIGRNPVYVIAFLLFGISCFLMPTASSYGMLVGWRLLFALGSSAASAMITAVLADYPRQESRGRIAGVMGLCCGLGALAAVFLFAQIPKWVGTDKNPEYAGEIMFIAAGSFNAVTALFLFFGLKRGPPPAVERDHLNILKVIKEGISAARRPLIFLAYIAAFAARGDAVVLSSFLSLWINKYYIVNGLPEHEALSRVGVITGIAQTFAIIAAPFVGIIADKLSKMVCLLIVSIIAFVAYGGMLLISSPTGAAIYILAILIGIGQIGMVLTSQILVAAGSPKESRGAVSGLFGLCSSISIIVTTKLGGYLFDNWRESGPFLLVTIGNSIVLLVSIFAIIHTRFFNNAVSSNNKPPPQAKDNV